MRRCFLPRNCCRLMGSPVVLGSVKSGALSPTSSAAALRTPNSIPLRSERRRIRCRIWCRSIGTCCPPLTTAYARPLASQEYTGSAQSPLLQHDPPGRDAAFDVAGSPDEHESDEPGQPQGLHRDAGEYDKWGEANHKSGVKIA